ncbi:MAG: hypothetical protein WBA70_06135, partial [Thermodesulfobacteriota bacterium]
MKFVTTQVGIKLFQHSKKAFSLFTLTLLLITSFFILNQNAEAQELVCPTRAIEQITNDPEADSERPTIDASGTLVAFDSEGNINGTNPDGNDEIYLFDTTTGIIIQITFTTSGDSIRASINSIGTRIAFQSSANINGTNPEGNREIYLFDITTGIFTQITFTTSGSSESPSINSIGTRI